MSSSTTDPQPSKLGTKEYWDNVYEKEVENFEEFGDEGEVWFGEETVEKMTDWLLEYFPPEDPASSSALSNVLEVGSGNGTLLLSALEAGYHPIEALGVDYSSDAVDLSKKVAKNRGFVVKGDEVAQVASSHTTNEDSDTAGQEANEKPQVEFRVEDFLDEAAAERLGKSHWDLVLDKGTFDAIALMSVELKDGKEIVNSQVMYARQLSRILKSGGIFLITSCNFTEDELKTKFGKAEYGLVYHSRVQHPSFTFGGHLGTIVATVAFKKT